MPQLNKPLFRKIKEHIRKQPKRLCMGWWIQKDKSIERNGRVKDHATYASSKLRDYDFPVCGTAACIGGWAVLLCGKEFTELELAEMIVDDKAKELLGLTVIQAETLFAVPNWQDKYRIAYETAKSHKAKAAATIGRINYLLRYGK